MVLSLSNTAATEANDDDGDDNHDDDDDNFIPNRQERQWAQRWVKVTHIEVLWFIHTNKVHFSMRS